MEKKNRELAKRNTELLEEISRLTDIHSDILKDSIKQRYYRTRNYHKIVDQVDKQVGVLKEMLEGSLHLKSSLLRIMEVNVEEDPKVKNPNESESSVFTQTMKILDTICNHEDQEIKQIEDSKTKVLNSILEIQEPIPKIEAEDLLKSPQPPEYATAPSKSPRVRKSPRPSKSPRVRKSPVLKEKNQNKTPNKKRKSMLKR